MMAQPTQGSTSFDCSVCLEALDQPSSIDLEAVLAPNIAAQRSSVPPMPILVAVNANGGVSGAGQATSGRGPQLPVIDSNADRRIVVATTCGHLFHQVCIFKWFGAATRGKSCPSCCKLVPNPNSQVIRLYPSSAAGGPSSSSSAPNPNAAAPVPSTSSGTIGTRNGDCAACQDKTVIHDTLIRDYDGLQQRCRILVDANTLLRNNEALKDTQIQSLVEDNDRKNAQLAQLQSEMDALRGSAQASLRRSARNNRRN